MRRLARILLNAATTVSLVLCVATVVLWVRSYYAADDYIGWSRPAAAGNIWSTRGEVIVVRLTPHEGHAPFEETARPFHIRFPPSAGASPGEVAARRVVPRLRRVAGFAYGAGGIPSYAGRAWIVPLWSLAAVLGALPVYRGLRRRRSAIGHCPACGFDLRATPGRCPECGLAVAPETEA